MLDEIIISIDAMGGDNAPEIVIKGIDYFLKHEGKNRNAKFLLHGNKDILSKLLKKSNLTSNCSVIIAYRKVHRNGCKTFTRIKARKRIQYVELNRIC